MLTRSKRAHDGTLVEHSAVPTTRARTHPRTSITSQVKVKSTVDGVDAESVRFMEPLFANQVFLQTLTAQEILNIKNVSKTWAQWTAENTNNDIIRARSSDDRRDWYFPLFGPADVEVTAESSQPVPMLHGMWHATADGLAESKLGKLPDLLYLPPPSTFSACICNPRERKEVVYVVRASLGGLLLVETVTKLTRHRHPHALNRHDPDCSMSSRDWPSLMVTNPLTKKFQVLPIYNADIGDRWWHRNPDFFMMVDENTNSYKVLVYGKLLNECSNLFHYDSRSMTWEEVRGFDRLMQPPLGMWTDPVPPVVIPYLHSTFFATACAHGRLYLADIRKPTNTESNMDRFVTAVVRLFEVDIATGGWVLRTEVPFRKLYIKDVKIQHIKTAVEYDIRFVHRNLELVECMEKLYAIIPARLDEILYHPKKYHRRNTREDVDKISSKYMPLQFYVFQLTGEVGVEGHGVLRIETPPRKNCEHLARRQRLFNRSTIIHKRYVRQGLGNWFSCTAKGSIIWVSTDEYLLQYDVVLGECKTEFVPKHIQNHEKAGVAYRANFHIKP